MVADATHNALLEGIATKKATLDQLRREKSARAIESWEHAQDLELTYTSNAIEGNTLTQRETAEVIEHGITVGGKTLKEHLEAVDLFEATGYVRELAKRSTALTEIDVRNLHALVLKRSEPDSAGRYAEGVRYVNVAGGRHFFPSPAEVPALMGDFAAWLGPAPATPDTAFGAHFRLVNIHPFDDGNGRTARLLMNLILIRGGYPPIAVRPVDRPRYIEALEKAGGAGDPGDFQRLLRERLDATLGEYVSALREALPHSRAAPGRKPTP